MPASPYYTAFDSFLDERTLWMNCAVQRIDRHDLTSNAAELRSADITINPAAGTYKINSSNLAASISYGPNNAGTAWWDKGEYYTRDSLTYERFYFKGHFGFGIASLPVTPKPSFVKFLNNSYDTRDYGYFTQWCLGGIKTRYEDIPASVTFTSSQTKLIRGGFRENIDPLPYDFADSLITVSLTKADNRVTISMTLFGEDDFFAATPPTLIETVTGTGTIDPATGQFAGTLDAGADAAGSMFRGALYGPTGSEIGLTLVGYRTGSGSAASYRPAYVLAAAGAH